MKHIRNTNWILFSIIFTTFFACSNVDIEDFEENEEMVREYYFDGSLKMEGTIISGRKNGVFKWYYPNWRSIEIEAEYVNDTINGSLKQYYPNNVLKGKESYQMGRKHGVCMYYFPNGYLNQEKEYKTIYNSPVPYLNTWKKYDSLGNLLIEQSHFYEILNSKFSYHRGERDSLEIQLTAPYFNSKMNIILTSFNSEFDIKEGADIKRIESNGFLCKIPLSTENKGQNLMRFIINDYRLLNDSVAEQKAILVEYSYIVE